MKLDFKGLLGDHSTQEPTDPIGEPKTDKGNTEQGATEKPTEKPTEEPAGVLTRAQQNRQAELDRARLVYAEYQDNIKLSEQTRADILLSLKAGQQDFKTLLLKACYVISVMTGEKAYYTAVEQAIHRAQADRQADQQTA